jgi:hypothetical protein
MEVVWLGIGAIAITLGYFASICFHAIRFALLRPVDRRRRLAILETNYGREAGWLVEYHGGTLAILTEPRFEDMFWDSYRIQPVATDDEDRHRILCDRDWWGRCEFVFRSRQFDQCAKDAFPALDPFPEPGRVKMRGLYLQIQSPTPWEKILLWWKIGLCRRRHDP